MLGVMDGPWYLERRKNKKEERKAFYEPSIISRNRTCEHVKRRILFPLYCLNAIPVMEQTHSSQGLQRAQSISMLNTFSYKEGVCLFVFICLFMFYRAKQRHNTV